GVLSGTVLRWRIQRVGRGGATLWVHHECAVKDVREIRANGEHHGPIALGETEAAHDVEALLGPALTAEVGIQQGRLAGSERSRAVCTVDWVRPGSGIQDLRRRWIKAVAVQILQIQRLTCTHHLASAGEVVGRRSGRGRERQPARVLHEGSDFPIPPYPRQDAIPEMLLRLIDDAHLQYVWLVRALDSLCSRRIKNILPGAHKSFRERIGPVYLQALGHALRPL